MHNLTDWKIKIQDTIYQQMQIHKLSSLTNTGQRQINKYKYTISQIDEYKYKVQEFEKTKTNSEENNSSHLKDTPKIISVPVYLQARDLKPAPPKRFCKLTIKHSISFTLQKQLESK